MPFFQEQLQILATLGSALAVYIFIRMAAKRDTERLEKQIDKVETRIDKMEIKFDKHLERIESRLEKTDDKISSIDTRLTKIEWQLNPPPHWEPKVIEKKED